MKWYLKVRAMYGTAKWAVLRRQRAQELARLMPSGKLSPSFRYVEFATKDGMPIPLRSVKTLRWFCVNVLEVLREQFGPCYVTSGYRHFHYNASIGGASDSRHVWDKRPTEPAVDVSFARGTPEQWAQAAAGILRRHGIGGGIGVYRRLRFTHIDLRKVSARWAGSGEPQSW